jgi:hypothetical protein
MKIARSSHAAPSSASDAGLMDSELVSCMVRIAVEPWCLHVHASHVWKLDGFFAFFAIVLSAHS